MRLCLNELAIRNCPIQPRSRCVPPSPLQAPYRGDGNATMNEAVDMLIEPRWFIPT